MINNIRKILLLDEESLKYYIEVFIYKGKGVNGYVKYLWWGKIIFHGIVWNKLAKICSNRMIFFNKKINERIITSLIIRSFIVIRIKSLVMLLRTFTNCHFF